MPHASDLEEFGLEVERENHALITPPTRTTRAGGSVLPLTTPTKEQRTLLQTSNSRTPTFIQQRGSGILKWTILLLALTMAVFLHLQQESDTTQYVEQTLLADVEECIDDPEFSIMLKSEKNCASYVANIGRRPLLESRCSSPIGIPDEDGFQKLLKHFCRKSCGLCGTEDTISEDESDEEIEEEVHVIAEEIEEKELEEEIEKELEEEIELEKELEEQEKEMMNDGADENEEEDGAEDGEEDEGVDGNVQQQHQEEAVPSDEEDSDNEGGDNATNGEEDGEGSDNVQSSDIAEEEFVGVAPAEEGGESTIVEQGDNNSTESYIGDVSMAVEEPNDAGGESDAPAEDAKRANDYVAEVKNDTVVVVVEDMEEKTPAVEASVEGKTSNQQAVVDFGGKFTLQHIQATREAATNLIEELEQYYSGTDQAKRMMLDAWQSPWKFDNPKDERVDKIVDTIARALVTDNQSEFVIGTIGSSVAAGHDNCHYDSYESQLERTFGPVWEAAGMKFVNQNSGIGGEIPEYLPHTFDFSLRASHK